MREVDSQWLAVLEKPRVRKTHTLHAVHLIGQCVYTLHCRNPGNAHFQQATHVLHQVCRCRGWLQLPSFLNAPSSGPS